MFSLEGKKYTYQDTMVKSFQMMLYTISHYKPVDVPNNKLLELITIANDLPRMNMIMLSILKLFGQREKMKFQNHTLADLTKDLKAEQEKPERQQDQDFIDQANSIINYLSHLKIYQIVTPVKKITEFLEDDLIASDPKFPGNCIDAALVAEEANKKINNVPIRSKTAWMKYALVFMMIGFIGAVVYIANEQGVFDQITGLVPDLSDFSLTPTAPQQSDLLKKYPTPESMRAAIDSGQLDYASLPPNIKAMVDEIPSVGVSP